MCIGPTQGKRDYEKIQEVIIIIIIVTSVMFNNLAPATWEIKNEESIQVFHPQIVDTRDTGQYMPDDRS